MSDELELALELADIADVVTVESFRDRDLVVDSKPDMSLVSAADKAAEQALRAHLQRVRPNDAVLGEEFGSSGAVPAAGQVRWILDPIDGTHNYVRNVPVWATLIAAEVDGEVVAGVVSAPALGRRWWAARGEGAFADGQPIKVSEVSRLEDAHLSSGWDEMLYDPRWLALSRRAWRTRGFGDFWSVVLVAEGAVDVAVEPGYAWDLAPLYVIVEEAGGRCTSLAGERSLEAEHVVATNGRLHAEVLGVLGAI